MSTQDIFPCPDGPHAVENALEAGSLRETKGAAYYEFLAGRLKVLIHDIELAGIPADGDLVMRLRELLSDTRVRLGESGG
jgi:hypothetical protein